MAHTRRLEVALWPMQDFFGLSFCRAEVIKEPGATVVQPFAGDLRPMGKDMQVLPSGGSRVSGARTEARGGWYQDHHRGGRRGMSQLWEGRARLGQGPGLDPESAARPPVF